MNDHRRSFCVRILIPIVVFVFGLCLHIQVDAQGLRPNVKSAQARKAEAEFQATIDAAEKEYLLKVKVGQTALLKELEIAKEAATKSADLEDAVAIRDRIAEVQAMTPSAPNVKRGSLKVARDKLSQTVSDVTWIGSPNFGQIVFKADGTLVTEKAGGFRWTAVDGNMICAVSASGGVDLYVFDEKRQKVKAFAIGNPGNPAWEASRQNQK